MLTRRRELQLLSLLAAIVASSCSIDQPNSEYRLPNTVIPRAYDIKLSEVNFTRFTFTGTVRINAKVVLETQEVVLHKGNLSAAVTSVIDVTGSRRLEVTETRYNKTTEKFSILLKENLKPETEITLHLVFNGVLREDMIGFYRSSYIDRNGQEKWLASTQFEATHARHAFPCFDEPALKSTFNISILPPEGYNCLSNMPQKITGKWCIFEQSVPMSTYLVAFIISDFVPVTNPTRNFTVWSRPGTEDQSSYGLKVGIASLDYFAKLLDEPYQLPKMDMVAVPDFSAGAMENWGLITYRETAVLYDENISSAAAQQRVASVIVHECTHMWFGNLVTPHWWSYLWLSEAFARYYQYMATNELETEWKMDQQFVVEQHQVALGVDGLKDSAPMTRAAITQSQIGKMGDSITYSKGASIVRMMEKTFGTNVFNGALRDYLKLRRYKAATPNDLWGAIQRRLDKTNDPQLNISVSTVMKSWTEQAGFPYITVTIKPDHISFSQQRFFLRHPNTIPTESTWWVPITWTLSSQLNASESTKPVYWLSKRHETVPNKNSNDDWLILNVQSAGFYRVKYDDETWSKLIKFLTTGDFEKIHPLTRAAIVDDLLNLARAELLSYEIALRGIQYLKKETNYLPFKSAFTALDYLIRKFSSSPDNNLFKEYIISLFAHVYEKLTYDDRDGDDRLTILLRQEVITRACKLGYPDCVSKSRKYFSEWRAQQKPIPKNQRSTAYCTAIRYGTRDDWEFLWEQYRNANVAAEQTTILSALGCSKDNEILEKYLLIALKGFVESGIRKQDISSVFSGVYFAGVEGAEYILQFIEKHYEDIFRYHNSYEEISSLVSGALGRYTTDDLIIRLETIINSNATHVKTIIKPLEESLKLAKFEQSWFNKYSGIIINWIKLSVNLSDSSTILPRATSSGSNENTTAYRLPSNVIPIHYKIHVTPFIVPGNFTFKGKVQIAANVTKKTSEIVLHADQLLIQTIDLWKLSNSNSTRVKLDIAAVKRRDKYHFTGIVLKSPIENGSLISIDISYTGLLNTEMRGFYRSSYKNKNEMRWLAATHLEPVGARRVFPCFDEPALKATFDITVTVPENYTAISNSKVKSVLNNTWEFERSPLMSTYLVAVVVSDFKSLTLNENERSYGVYSNPLVAHQLPYSLEVMQDVVKLFEDRLGHPYTLKKLEMVALPDFASGAMENWGLITYRETNMLFDPDTLSSLPSKQSIRNVIAHEVAHQWFGNLVSPLWWDYLWLSEGFARYFQYYAYGQAEASWNLETQFVVDHLQTSFSLDASTGTHPITHRVYSPSEIRAIFDRISYAKAASVIRMLGKLTGPEIFYKALHRYLTNCKYSTGTPKVLFRAFQNEINETMKLNVTKLMLSWTIQPGFPVVNVTFNNNKVASVSQTRFYIRPVKNKTEKSLWVIPITWATRSHPNFNNTQSVVWLQKKTKLIQIPNISENDWVIFNVQQTGYYRVNYDQKMWWRIIAALNSKEYSLIHEVNRASLLDDLLNLGRAGLVDYDLVFEGTRYLLRETAYAPWKTALTGLTYLNRRFAGQSETNKEFRTYLLELLEPNFRRLGFSDVKDENHSDTLLRKLVLEWMCNLGYDECVKEAVKLFKRLQNEEGFTVPPNQRNFVYCTAIRHGTTDDWNYLWNMYEKSIYAAEKLTILNALACSQNSTNLKRLLSNTINSGEYDEASEPLIKLQDAKKVFTYVVDGGLIGVQAALEFIEDNFANIQKQFHDDSIIKGTLNTITKRLSTQQLLEKFDNFVNRSIKINGNIAKTLQSGQKRAQFEMNWYNEHAPKIRKWLKANTPSEYRLPTYAKPEAYDIYIRPYLEDGNFTFDGKVVIDINIEEDTPKIVLHANDLEIQELKLEGISEEITNWEHNTTTHKLSIFFKSILDAGSKLQLSFKYTGHLRDDMRGFYRSWYTDEKGNTRWIATTQFAPAYARRAFPSFDEPLFKAKFTIHIAKPEGYHTLSNMGSSPTERKDNEGVIWDDYKPSLKMSPYLVAFVVSDFKNATNQNSRVAVWMRSQLKSYMNFAPIIGEKSLSLLENFTQIPYPLEKMNFVAVPDFDMGAMENWGLVTYREYGLTYDIFKISATYKKYAVTVIAHELVHMWFGNLVTCEWWDYTWLNEGFAQYISYIISNQVDSKWQLLNQFVVNEVHVALEFDSSETSHPMNHKINTPSEAQDGFDKIAYQKSASVLRMLHHSFGQQLFVEGLQIYLNNHKYNTARPENLYSAIQTRLDQEQSKISGNISVDVASIMSSWTTQSGYPVVSALRTGTTVTLSQERFLVSPSKSGKRNETYWVPITYTTDTQLDFKNTSPKLWLNKEEQRISLSSNDKWFILNIQEIGYYRVNYDKGTWQQLVELLNSDKFSLIDEVNRAQLIDDALNLARAGYLDYEIALEATKYLAKETSYIPWKALLNALGYLSQRIEGRSDVKKLFATHITTLVKKPFETLGFVENMIKDSYYDQLTRELILTWACKYGHENCIQQSKEYFAQNRITPNIAATVYCTAIEHGTSEDWETLWNKYTNTILATDYITILKSLGCSRNVTILEKYLDLILQPNSDVRKQDAASALSSIYTSSQVGLQTTINYFQNNIQKLYNYYRDWHEVGSLFTSVAARISTEAQIENLERFINDTRAVNVKSSLKSAITSARKNLKWFNENSNKIYTWLKNNYDKENPTSIVPIQTSSTNIPTSLPTVETPIPTTPPTSKPNSTSTSNSPDPTLPSTSQSSSTSTSSSSVPTPSSTNQPNSTTSSSNTPVSTTTVISSTQESRSTNSTVTTPNSSEGTPTGAEENSKGSYSTPVIIPLFFQVFISLLIIFISL